ncbi:MAG TPA: dTDP-4-dehydrorhamnose 3,5-epimerase family protein [Elusimicrobiota bacterium]|nr:dTDP-4-dehydrorhamnose 3,5-epimerase family protein [Elusimicrobiota bacterium]
MTKPTDLSNVKWNAATLKDVRLVPLTTHQDDRGYLVEIAHSTDPYLPKFGQVYLVGNPARGAVRAFHKHAKLWDLFSITHGSAKFVLVDDRPESPTRGEANVFVLSHKDHSLLVVPPGVYHGWMSLEDDTQMISTASEVYDRGRPDEVRIPPDSFGDVWTVKGR